MDNEQTNTAAANLQKRKKLLFITSKIKKISIWSKEEDKILLKAAEQYGYKNWKAVAAQLKGRTPLQCLTRSKRIRPGVKKGSWSPEEDQELLEHVRNFGKNWSLIAKHMPKRTGKQIRERYLNALDPSIIKDNFAPEEDEKIIDLYCEYGPSWSKIARSFKGRTCDMIKNRFYSSLKKKIHTNFSFTTKQSSFSDTEKRHESDQDRAKPMTTSVILPTTSLMYDKDTEMHSNDHLESKEDNDYQAIKVEPRRLNNMINKENCLKINYPPVIENFNELVKQCPSFSLFNSIYSNNNNSINLNNNAVSQTTEKTINDAINCLLVDLINTHNYIESNNDAFIKKEFLSRQQEILKKLLLLSTQKLASVEPNPTNQLYISMLNNCYLNLIKTQAQGPPQQMPNNMGTLIQQGSGLSPASSNQRVSVYSPDSRSD